MPSLKLLLTPFLACDKADQSIHVRMTVNIPAITKYDFLFHHLLVRDPIKTQQYTTEAIQLRDSQVPLQVFSQDTKDNRQRKFFAGKELSASRLTVEYTATLWNPTESSPFGSQIALERDGGGLNAAGM